MAWRRQGRSNGAAQRLQTPLAQLAIEKGRLLRSTDLPFRYAPAYIPLAIYVGSLHPSIQDGLTDDLSLERGDLTRSNLVWASTYASLLTGLGVAARVAGDNNVDGLVGLALDVGEKASFAYAAAIALVATGRFVHYRRTGRASWAPMGLSLAVTVGVQAYRSARNAAMDLQLLWMTKGKAESFPLVREDLRALREGSSSFVSCFMPENSYAEVVPAAE